MSVAVVIPIYKQKPDNNELCALKQCAKILSKRDIFIVCPNDLDITIYEEIFSACKLACIRFDNNYFKSVDTYSRLLLGTEFYERFNNYEYMLICQPDAWIFKDELDYWCSLGYSYIGAPWFKGDKLSKFAGNGGFCLRKISDMIKLFSLDKNIKISWHDFGLIYYRYKKLRLILLLVYMYIKHFLTNEYFWKTVPMNEDMAIVLFAHRFMKDFNPAPPEVAMKFSFEVHPEVLYELNDKQLPFGCHAYLKYNPEFWKKFIPCV